MSPSRDQQPIDPKPAGLPLRHSMPNEVPVGDPDRFGSMGNVFDRLPQTHHAALSRMVFSLSVLWVVLICGGATCNRGPVAMPYPPPPPITLSDTPTIEEVSAAVNRTSTIRELSCTSAKIDVLSMALPTKLNATLHLRRDRDFRMRASIPMGLGSGIDLGSNNDLFWFEVPEGMGKTLYYARHDQYQQQLQRTVLPVDPTWIMDALGLVEIDPSTVVAGPIVRSDSKLEVRTAIERPDGIYNHVYYIDPEYLYVTDQLLYDPQKQLLAASKASEVVFYPTGGTESEPTGCVLPHSVQVQLLPNGGEPLAMQIDVTSYTVNQLLSGDPNLFTMPTGPGIDLAAGSPFPTASRPVATTAGRQSAYQVDPELANPIRGW